MTAPITHSRSPELMCSQDSAVLIVDVQEKLVPAIHDAHLLVGSLMRLVDGAKLLDVPVLATEQYRKGLGPTVSPLLDRIGSTPDEKLTFSCCGCPALMERLGQLERPNLLVVGIEAHVCVQQTVLDLLHAGFRVFVATDAVGSRRTTDLQGALRRMETSGAILTTVESVLFEWCETAAAPRFKELSRLVKPPVEPVRVDLSEFVSKETMT